MKFVPTSAQLVALERLLTVERLTKYSSSTNGDPRARLAMYERNTELAEAFYTPLQGLEVCLRNAINIELSAAYGDEWYENHHHQFNRPLTEMLAAAHQSLERDGKAVTNGGIVAELNFGFWAGILGPRYEAPLWRQHLHRAFPNGPGRHRRKEVQGALNAIRRLRNRVAHHEPILHRDLATDHELILRIIAWMCIDTSAWVGALSRLPSTLAAIQTPHG